MITNITHQSFAVTYGNNRVGLPRNASLIQTRSSMVQNRPTFPFNNEPGWHKIPVYGQVEVNFCRVHFQFIEQWFIRTLIWLVGFIQWASYPSHVLIMHSMGDKIARLWDQWRIRDFIVIQILLGKNGWKRKIRIRGLLSLNRGGGEP